MMKVSPTAMISFPGMKAMPIRTVGMRMKRAAINTPGTRTKTTVPVMMNRI